MGGRRWIWVGAWAASFAVFAAGVTFFALERGGDGATAATDELPPLAAMPFPAGVTTLGDASVQVGDQVALGVEANTAEGVESISLYDGARRVRTVPADPGRSTATVTYPALSVGPHALYVEVTDGAGRTSLSAVTEVAVAPAASPPPLQAAGATEPVAPSPGEQAERAEQPVVVAVATEADETPTELAARLGVEPDAVVVDPTSIAGADGAAGEDPPAVEVDDPIPAGATVVVRVPRDHGASGPEAPVVTTPTIEPAGDGLSLAVEAADEGCELTLSATGGSGDIAFYEGSSAGWAKVGRATGDRTAEVRALAPGAHVFIARDGDGAQSAPVSVAAPTSCRAGTGWRGEAAIVGGNLLLPPDAAGGRTYLYLRVGDRSLRVPAGQDEYLAAQRVTPISTYLPRLSGASLGLEVWSDRGGTTFARTATGSLAVPEGETLTSILGEPSGLALEARLPGGGPYGSAVAMGERDGPIELRWTSASPRVTEVMWQVLLDDRPSTDHRLSPGDLLAAGTSKVSITDAAGNGGRFTIDSSLIPGRGAAAAGEAKAGGAVASPQVISPPYLPGSIAKVPAAKGASVVTDVSTYDVEQPVLTLPTFGDTVRVRVVALTDDVAATAASPTVPVTLPVPDGVDGTPVDMVVTGTTYDAGRAADPALANCVRLTVPWTRAYGALQPGSLFQANVSWLALSTENAKPGAPPGGWTPESAQLSQTYRQSGTICPDRVDPNAECTGFFDCLAEAVGDLYSLVKSLVSAVVDLYNGAIDVVVSSIVEYSGLCQIIGAASDSAGAQSTCTSVMTVVTKAAIGVALASVGLPVSLPSADDLEAIAAGDLAVVMVSLAEQLGMPCSAVKTADPAEIAAFGDAVGVGTTTAEAAADPCLAMANAIVGSVRDQVVADTTAATAASGPWPNVSGIEGASLIPEPNGRPSAQALGITMEVADADAQLPEGFLCGVQAKVTVPPSETEWLVTSLQLQPVSADRRRWAATVSSADYRERALSPWMPMLVDGFVLTLQNAGTAKATFDTAPASTFVLPSGAIGLNQCQIPTAATKTDAIVGR